MEDYVFRDPADHVEEIQCAYNEFSSLMDLYAEQPRNIDRRFLKLLYDLSHVVHHHSFADEFARKVCAFLETHPESLRNDVRLQLAQAVMKLHNRGVLDTAETINKLIPLFRLNDKNLRRCVFGHFIKKLPFHQTNATKRDLHKFVSSDYDSRVGFKCLQLVVDIFHKENLADGRTINFVARCLTSTDPRVVNVVVSFFLDPYVPRPEEEEINFEEERRKAEVRLKVNSKTKAREKKVEKAKRAKTPIPQDPVQVIELIDDPQKFAVRLFSLLAAPETGKVFKAREAQIRAMSLLSKVISSFQLDFDQFFNWASRFIRPAYDEITKLLVIIASAVHPLTNPDALSELLRTIADRFVVDHLDEEVMIVGMNTIREICAKNPHGMSEALAADLAAYKKADVKGVVVAARGIISLYREVMPDILPKKDRGRDPKTDSLRYGEIPVDEEGTIEELDEDTLLEGSRVHKRTKEEKLETAREGKPVHGFRSRMADKTAGFSDREKLKSKPFMLTRFRKNAGHVQTRNLNAIQKDKKKRAGREKARFA